MNTYRKLHVASYVLGVTTGVVLASCGALLLGLHLKRSIELEQVEMQTLAELQLIDGDGLRRQLALDTVANNYAHLRMGIYNDAKLVARVEESARKQEDLAGGIEKRRQFWEKNE